MITVGEEWAYRYHVGDPIERVVIRRQKRGGQYPRYEVEFLDGDKTGQLQEIPARRLAVRWESRVAYEADVARAARVEVFKLTEVEASAVNEVFDVLIPPEIASCYSVHAEGVAVIYDRPALEQLTGLGTADLTENIEWYDDQDGLVVSAEGGLRIAESICRRHANTMLGWVYDAETQTRVECRRYDGPEHVREIDPEVIWRVYHKHGRHVYELLRHWCGHRAITTYERIEAAEAEAHRLDELLERVLDTLHKSNPRMTKYFGRERDEHRITAEIFRPIVERPLDPREFPAQIAYRSRHWG